MRKLPPGVLLAAALVALLGVAGLVRGAVPLTPAAVTGDTGAAPIVVSGAFVRPPVPPAQEAAAYFTVYNTTGEPDTLQSVATGAGAVNVLHTLVGGVMTAVTGGVTVPAHGQFVLSTGTGHLMISQLFGPLQAGQTVDIELTFTRAGPVTVQAPVVPFGAAEPTSTATTGATK